MCETTRKHAYVRWKLGISKIIVSKVEFLETREVKKSGVRVDNTLHHATAQIKTDNVTGRVVTSDSIPITTICTCIPVHHNWRITRAKPIFTFVVILIMVIIDGGKVLFKVKQSEGMLNRAFMSGVERRG
ncbi:hypothetical protein HanXRQr2_Chr14g0666701 [Helianthus annuus]|uniref:Uncharacterized protein n=1 Tax=Helianthus annuus TaxID=4232 RepID=A0A9K3EBX6_HELAN|nr:hypothetical protein HanXRQr2_Chr14g0666701 [Helianthus annuus]KAJ0842264.1 hypothetical protein HanPSC8_Chr14g0639691 [Helianthus annuus]